MPVNWDQLRDPLQLHLQEAKLKCKTSQAEFWYAVNSTPRCSYLVSIRLDLLWGSGASRGKAQLPPTKKSLYSQWKNSQTSSFCQGECLCCASSPDHCLPCHTAEWWKPSAPQDSLFFNYSQMLQWTCAESRGSQCIKPPWYVQCYYIKACTITLPIGVK